MTTASLPELPEDRFEIVEQLGEGGMATVYRALDRETQDWVAVKLLHDKYVGKSKIRQRFATEANAMMRLKHRNVVHVIHLNREALQPYFAMELAQGGCVVDWLAEYGAMPPKMAVDIAIQVCKGLGAAHRQGVVHRDVKPHNILVNRRGVCKITDFGIAQLEDDEAASLTRTGSVMGTLGYIAPEQRTNAKDVDERSDIYSVTATLYTMVTARTTMDLFFADQEPEMMEGVHEALVPILLKGSRYRREERHQTMRELAKELYHVKAQLPDDPPDTPSLVMNSVETLNSELERFTTSERTSETPFSAITGGTVDPVDMTGESDSDPTLGNSLSPLRQSTTPGIPRAQLIREQEEAEQRKRSRRLLTAAGGALGGIFLLCGLVLGGAALSGRSAVSAQVAATEQTYDRLEQTLEAEFAVVDELEMLGADRAPLQARWVSWQAAEASDRTAQIETLLRSYRKVLQANQPPAGSSRVHVARKVDARLIRIQQALERAQASERALAVTRATSTGRLATALFGG